jgi:seryl-tRNA synthetase
MAAFGHCFRTEAGAAGAGTRGLYRLHQFSKVELFVICTPEQSEAVLDELLAFETGLYSELGLHFQILDIAAGDLGAPAYRKFDVEAWMPGLNKFGEISSASNCTDYQARRLNIKYRPPGSAADNKPALRFAHTLNATACAVPRMIIAILETHQREDGSVGIPAALQPFMGGMSVIAPAAAAAVAAEAA